MKETHDKLVARWRAAAKATMEAQRRLDAAFEAFVGRNGPPPPQSQLDELRGLQQVEHECLLVAMRHLERQAGGLSTEPGALH